MTSSRSAKEKTISEWIQRRTYLSLCPHIVPSCSPRASLSYSTADFLILFLHVRNASLCYLSLICSLIFALFSLWLMLCCFEVNIISLYFAFCHMEIDDFGLLLCSGAVFLFVWCVFLWVYVQFGSNLRLAMWQKIFFHQLSELDVSSCSFKDTFLVS